MAIEERQTERKKREMQAYLPLGFWVLPWFVSIGMWKEGQQTAATVIVIVGNDEEAAHRNVAGFFCPLLCLPASNYYSCAAADSCGVYTVWGLLSSFAANSWHESSSCISFVSWLGFASPSCGCVQGLGYPLFELKKTWNSWGTETLLLPSLSLLPDQWKYILFWKERHRFCCQHWSAGHDHQILLHVCCL